MSLFNDFLDSKIVVSCRTDDELRNFIFMLDGAGVLWASGGRASSHIPYNGGCVMLVIPPPDLGYSRGRLYKTSSDWAVENRLSIVDYSDIDEEQNLRVMPPPLSLLYPKEAPNEPV